jgi:hypothetical protein
MGREESSEHRAHNLLAVEIWEGTDGDTNGEHKWGHKRESHKWGEFSIYYKGK